MIDSVQKKATYSVAFVRVFYVFEALVKRDWPYGSFGIAMRFDTVGTGVRLYYRWRTNISGTFFPNCEEYGNTGLKLKVDTWCVVTCTTKVASIYNDTTVNVVVNANAKACVVYMADDRITQARIDTGAILYTDTIPIPVNKLPGTKTEVKIPQAAKAGAVIKTFDINGRPVDGMRSRGVYFLWDGNRMRRQIKL
jgi:hypothetical protein